MKRRDFIKGASFLSALTLYGCGSTAESNALTGGGQPLERIPQASFRGLVNLSQIGGTGLRALSLYANPASVAESGSFITQVSAQGAQALFVVDGGRNLRALGLSLPGVPATPMDAASTVLTLAFLTRGISSTVVSEAIDRLARLQNLAGFAPAVTFAQGRLLTQNVAQLVADPTFATLMKALVEQWFAQPGILARSEIPPVEPDPSGNGSVGLSYPDTVPTGASKLELKNAAWRFVSVFRQDLDAEGNEVPPTFKKAIDQL